LGAKALDFCKMKHYAIIGKPVTHSISGHWFMDYFRKASIDADFRMIEPVQNDINRFNQWVAEQHLDGLLVTIPYKKEVIPYLDTVDEHAAMIGAVNVIAVRDGKLTGLNTDFSAFESELLRLRPEGFSKAIVMGIGGAAAAVVYALQRLNVQVLKVSRRKEVSDKVYSELQEQDFRNADLIINATPLGMEPLLNECPLINYHWLNPDALAYDLIYNPSVTLFLKKSAKIGCQTANGRGMVEFVYERALEIWGL